MDTWRALSSVSLEVAEQLPQSFGVLEPLPQLLLSWALAGPSQSLQTYPLLDLGLLKGNVLDAVLLPLEKLQALQLLGVAGGVKCLLGPDVVQLDFEGRDGLRDLGLQQN
mmetsp:Transcript_18656/g.31907  ORF Transcript_18656/g.31907 Transcript_18656/m.31907 type:complete len:110 (+) Transcript_18656:93-422(+)